MANMRNKWEFYGSILEALGVEYTEAELKNNETLRAKLLEGLGVEHTYDDVNQYPLWREKLVEGVGNMSGGGESDFSTAQVTVNSSTSLMYKLCLSNYYDYENTGIIMPEIASGDIDTSITLNAVLYKGQAMCIFTPLSANYPNISVSGNIQNAELGTYIITGDCTITIS